MKLAIDLTHCSHSSAQTGIQQVARGVWRTLPGLVEGEAVVFDKYADFWRPLDRRERVHLETVDALQKVKRKRPHWSTWQRIRGRFLRRFGRGCPIADDAFDGVLLPEFFAEWVGPRLPELRPVCQGPMVAIFHDAIAFHEPQWGVKETIERYPQYLRELSTLDAVACVSEFSRRQLLASFEKVGVAAPRLVEAIPLGLRTDHLPERSQCFQRLKSCSGGKPVFLTVATIEPRKNHAALLEAAESLWKAGLHFQIVLVGMLNRGSGQGLERTIRRLQAEGYALEWHGSVSATELARLYQTCDATLFPSHCEGFGLPVLESLYFGRPCLSSNGGALAEVAVGPGVLVSSPEAEAFSGILRRYLQEDGLAAQLTREAQSRQVRSMEDYTADLVDFVQQAARTAAG